jgi:hypothetical protein
MYILYTTGANALSSTFGTCVVDIFDFANTNKYKTIKTIAGHDVNGGTGYALIRSGHWRSNNAITSLYIYPSAGNFAEHSHFALYGIKVVS